MENQTIPCKALVLAGGGARGSYQVGVWKALMELDWHPQIITGTSVGSLNGAMFVLDLYEVARDMWLTIRSKDVMELPEENADLSALHSFLRSVGDRTGCSSQRRIKGNTERTGRAAGSGKTDRILPVPWSYRCRKNRTFKNIGRSSFRFRRFNDSC